MLIVSSSEGRTPSTALPSTTKNARKQHFHQQRLPRAYYGLWKRFNLMVPRTLFSLLFPTVTAKGSLLQFNSQDFRASCHADVLSLSFPPPPPSRFLYSPEFKDMSD